jgi:hypothetical protein
MCHNLGCNRLLPSPFQFRNYSRILTYRLIVLATDNRLLYCQRFCQDPVAVKLNEYVCYAEDLYGNELFKIPFVEGS